MEKLGPKLSTNLHNEKIKIAPLDHGFKNSPVTTDNFIFGGARVLKS